MYGDGGKVGSPRSQRNLFSAPMTQHFDMLLFINTLLSKASRLQLEVMFTRNSDKPNNFLADSGVAEVKKK
jgi:hypothetical protein